MIGLWILAGIFLLIVVPLFIRFGVILSLGDGFTLDLSIGKLKFRLYPAKKKAKKSTKRKKKAKKKKKAGEDEAKQKESPEKSGKNPSATLDLVFSALKSVRRHFLKITRTIHLRISVEFVVANEDVSKTAEEYGKLCAVFGNLTPLLYRLFSVHACSIRVDADFLAEKTRVSGDIRITSSLGAILIAFVPALLTFLKEYRNRKKQRTERKANV